MKILNISTRATGGAGIAAVRLNQYLNDNGYDSHLLIRYASKNLSVKAITPIHSYYYFVFEELLTRVLKRVIKNRHNTNSNYLIFNSSESTEYIDTKRIIQKVSFKPDVIILHWIDYFLNAKNIYDLYCYYNVPIIWTFMDMSPMTGGCHYAWNCKGYIDRCGKCPGLYSNNENDITNHNMLFKMNYLHKIDLIPVTCSEWTYRQALHSSLFRDCQIYKILLPVDPDVFKPAERKQSKRKIGVPEDRKVIFFGATYLNDERKGMSLLVKALKCLERMLCNNGEDVILMFAGKYNKALVDTLPFEHKYLGLIASEQLLALAYQAADLFVCPSVDDSGPLMINESIMCGTPVVSFEMGVALDLVHAGLTGYRAILGDSSDLAKGMKYILDLNPIEAVKISEECRSLGMKLCNPKSQVDAFREIIESKVHKINGGIPGI